MVAIISKGEMKMKKSDLVAGKHVIEVYGNEKYFVCGNYLLSNDGGFNLLDDYNDDLIMENDDESYFKVVKVYEIKQNRNLVSLMDSDNLKLVWERREKLTYFEKLTDFEKQILGHLIPIFEYIARDKDDSLYVYNQKPEKIRKAWEKSSEVWEIDEYEVGGSKMDNITVFDLLFPMIKWSDEEPTLISDLLNGCA